MNRYIKLFSNFVLGMAAFSALGVHAADAQSHSLDAGATYTYLRTNLLPGCNCFGTQGGSGEVQFGLSRRFDLLGDVTVTHRGGVTANQYDLTQTVFTAGVRYFPPAAHFRIRPFGDLLLGGAHAGGSLSPSNTGYGGSTTFAFQTGGGVQYPLTHRWTLIPIQADYLLTTFGNGGDNRQNDLRLSAGILFRLRR
jgi:outer membrane immunogenic protein